MQIKIFKGVGAEIKNGTLVVQYEIASKFASELKCALTDCFRGFSDVRSSSVMCAVNAKINMKLQSYVQIRNQ